MDSLKIDFNLYLSSNFPWVDVSAERKRGRRAHIYFLSETFNADGIRGKAENTLHFHNKKITENEMQRKQPGSKTFPPESLWYKRKREIPLHCNLLVPLPLDAATLPGTRPPRGDPFLKLPDVQEAGDHAEGKVCELNSFLVLGPRLNSEVK